MSWWSDQILWGGIAGVITAVGGLFAAIYQGKRQTRPATLGLSGAIEDLGEEVEALSEKVGEAVDILDANGRALSEIKGMLNVMMVARGR